MLRKTIAKSEIEKLVAFLAGSFKVLGPTAKEETFAFAEISDPAQLRLDYDTSILPPVRHIYPNHERLLRFKRGDLSATELTLESEPQVLFGVHPCDMHAIRIVDEIMNEEPADRNYMARRQETVIVGLTCNSPCDDNSLCLDKGTWQAESGFDILLHELNGSYILDIATEKGENALKDFGALEEATHGERRELVRASEDAESKFTRRLTMPPESLGHYLRESYDDMIWDAQGKKCLSCGSCNIVCPTCYCFDTRDQVSLDLENGERVRTWDGCQLGNFAAVAGGENFRKRSGSRLRHRIFRKEVYLQEKYLRSGCVGCGRCNRACIADISIIDIYNQVMGV